MSYKKPSPNRRFRLSTPVRLGVAAVAACFIALPVLSNPANPTVVNGTATFNQAGSALTVTNSNGAIINWDKFSIKAGETTHFAQPAASSAVLNRVLNDPTAIYGTLSSNGRVWLVNPAGIMVGPGGRVDTAGFVASTLAVRNEDFLAGRHLFVNDGNARNIINQGEIRTPAGGSVYLIGNNVSNEGIITTPKGETILAAGATVSLIDSATPGVKVDITGREGDATNLGQITAEAGRIGIAGVIVRNSGQLNASSVVNDGGRIFLKASQDAYVDKAGRIVTTGTRGGSVEVLGNRVAVMDDAGIDASGDNGGGSIKVGGDYQGKNPNIQNASITYFGPKASLRADATEAGDGGKVIVWADDTTRAYGSISARGGALGGNGGFVETSGKRQLDFKARIDASAPNGKSGTVLLDPDFIVIANGAGGADDGQVTGGQVLAAYGGAATFTISEQAIEGLQTGTVLLQANKGITLNDLTTDGMLLLDPLVQNFTLQTTASAANEGISFVNSSTEIKSSSGASINLIAGGSGSLTNIGKITSLGSGYPGIITLAAAGGSINLKGVLTATGGDDGGLIKLMAGSSIDLQGAVTASGGAYGGSVKLMAGAGGITSNGSGIITANTLEVISGGGVTLNAANDINILAGKVTGAISFTNGGSFAIGRIGGEPKFAYVVNYYDNNIIIYSIDAATGGLTQTGSIAAGTGPITVSVDPSGRFAYVPNNVSSTVSAYSINPTTGALSLVGTVAAAGGAYQLAIDPSGKYAYVTSYLGSNTVSAYSINPSTGALTPIGSAPTGTSPVGVTVDPSGRFAYVTNYGADNSVSAYSINPATGALTAIGTAVATGTTPLSVAVDPTGKYAYVTNYGSNTVSVYSINQSTGALTEIGTAVSSGGVNPHVLGIAPNGKFAYVNNSTSGNISAFSINSSTGELTSIGVVATGEVTGAVAVRVDPTSRFAYVPNFSFMNLRLFDINQTTGAVTASVAAGSYVAAGNGAYDVAIVGSGTSGITASGSVTLVAATGGITLQNAITSGGGNIEIAADSVVFAPGAFVGATAGNVGIRTLALALPTGTGISASGFVELAPLGNVDMCVYGGVGIGTCGGSDFFLNPSILSRVNPTGVLILGRAVADTGYTGTLTLKSGTTIDSSMVNGSRLALNGYDVVIEPGASIGASGAGNAFEKPLDILANHSLYVGGDIYLGSGQNLEMKAGQDPGETPGGSYLDFATGSPVISAGNISLSNPLGAISSTDLGTVLQTPGVLSANAYGGISLMGDNQVGTFVASNTGTGDIDFLNTGDFYLGAVTNSVTSGLISINGGGSITQTGNLASAGGNISLTAGNILAMNFGTKTQSYGGTIGYDTSVSGHGIQLGLLDAAGGVVNVWAGDGITSNGAPINIKASEANLEAGYADSVLLPKSITVNTQVSVLNVDNTNPGTGSASTIEIHNSGSALDVTVNSDSATGQLTITNDNTINVGHIEGATNTTLTANGTSSDIAVEAGGSCLPLCTLISDGNIILNAGGDIRVTHDHVQAYGGTVTATAGRDIRIASEGTSSAYIKAANGINLTMLTGGLYVDGTASYPAYISTTSGNIDVVTKTGFTNVDVSGNGANGALDAPLGRWLIYAPNPATVVGAPAYNFKQYNTAFGGAIQGAGNGLIYTLAPTISAALIGTVSKVYDGTNLATLTQANIGGQIGMVDGDNVVILGNPAAASYDTKNVGTGKTVTVNGLTIAATNTTAAAYGGNAQVYGYLFDGTASGAIGAITPRSLGLTGLVAQNKVYDGTAKVTLTGTLAGMVTGDIVGFAPGAGSFVDRHVGTAKTVNISGLALAGKDAGNYTLAGTTSSTTANITQLASVNWVGGTGTQWSTAANWAGGALPDRANVAAVILGNGPVTYDYGNAPDDTPILNALNLAGGTLTVTGGMLTVPTWLQSGGDLRGLGGLTVSQSMVMNGLGTIDIGGPVSISHTGNLHLGRIKTAGALSVTATGTLSGTNAAGTWVQTASSILLDASGIGTATDMLQTRTQELAINNRVGDAWIFNTGLVDVSGSSAGRLHLESHGGIVAGSSAQVTAGGKLDLIAHSPIVIGAAGVQGGAGVVLRADTPDPSNSSILISGPVSSPGGAVVVAAYNNVTQNANITGGSVSVGSAAGSIQMAATAQTQATGGNVSYKAPAGSMTLATINAGSGSVSLDAGGSIAPAPGTTGANITGASAFINAGGSLELSTNVTLLDVDVGGAFAVSNGGTVFSGQPAASTSGADQATKDLTNATNKALTDKTPTDRTEAPPPHDTSKTDTSKPFVDPGKTTGGTDGTFGSEGDKPSTETRKDGSGSKTASSGKDENGKDQKDEKDEKDKKDKKSDEAKDEKKDDKPVAKKVAQCT